MHIIIGHGFGGLENVMLDLVNEGDKEWFEYFILCLSTPDVVRQQLEESGATVLELGYGRGLHLGLSLAIQKAVSEHSIDIVHSHDFNPFFYTTLGCIGNRRLAKVYTEHSGILSLRKRHHWIVKMLSYANDAMVMVSEHLQQHYAKHVGIPKERTTVIHNGIDTNLFVDPLDGEILKQEFGLEGKLVIGSAVRLIEQKGLQYLIASASAVKERCPNVRFLVIGDGRLRDSLIAQTRELGVDDIFLFPGYRSDIARILPIFDIYVLPSLWEGLPLGVIEAMLAARPIVVTAVGGVREVMTNGENALLVPPADSDALAEALCCLVDSPDLRINLGERAREHAIEHFALDKKVRAYENLYMSILANK
jgi:glycosyltransferase involved in cell wall biosynthesis